MEDQETKISGELSWRRTEGIKSHMAKDKERDGKMTGEGGKNIKEEIKKPKNEGKLAK